MPQMPNKQCKYKECPEPTREIYCHLHKSYEKAVKRNWERRYKEDGNRDPFYSTNRWAKARNRFARKNPLCAVCFSKGVTKQINVVDHIVPIKQGGEKLDSNNFQSLCHQCHAEKTAKESK